MSLILGMDIWVFIAWIGTIFAAILCLLYGIYHEFFIKSDNEKLSSNQEKKLKDREDK